MADTPRPRRRQLIIDLPEDESDDSICIEKVKDLVDAAFTSGYEPYWRIETLPETEEPVELAVLTPDRKLQIQKLMFEAGSSNESALSVLHEAAEQCLEGLLQERYELNAGDKHDLLMAFKEGFWSLCHVEERKMLRRFVVKITRCRNVILRGAAEKTLKRSQPEAYDNNEQGIYETSPAVGHNPRRARKK